MTLWERVSNRHLPTYVKIINLIAAIWTELFLLASVAFFFLEWETRLTLTDSVIGWHAAYIFYFGIVSVIVFCLFWGGDSQKIITSRQDTKLISSFFIQSLIGSLVLFYFVFLITLLSVPMAFDIDVSIGVFAAVIGILALYVEFRVWYLCSFVDPSAISRSLFKELFLVFGILSLGSVAILTAVALYVESGVG